LKPCGFAVAAAFALSCAGDAHAAKKKEPPTAAFTRPEIVLSWMNDYRVKPTPERLPEAFGAMREQGQFKEVEQAGIYVGFVAGIIGSNPDKAEKLISAMFPMPPPDQVVLVKAIAYSGLADWKDLLGKFVERMPARTVIIERYLYGKLPAPMPSIQQWRCRQPSPRVLRRSRRVWTSSTHTTRRPSCACRSRTS
jgi:hypothetical protein